MWRERQLELNNLWRIEGAIVMICSFFMLLPDERYAPGRNDEEIGKLISIFLREQKEEVHRVFVLKYFY